MQSKECLIYLSFNFYLVNINTIILNLQLQFNILIKKDKYFLTNKYLTITYKINCSIYLINLTKE